MVKRARSADGQCKDTLPLLRSLCTSEDGIPDFVLDLDQPPETRWTQIAHAFRPRFTALVKSNADLLCALQAVSGIAQSELLPVELRAEVHALAALLGQPTRLLWQLQFVYEAFSVTDLAASNACGCTSAVIDCDDGVVHGRTLDWAWLVGLEGLLVNLEVRRGGELLYRCTSLVGFVGVLTGMRLDGFSLSLNYRRCRFLHLVPIA